MNKHIKLATILLPLASIVGSTSVFAISATRTKCYQEKNGTALYYCLDTAIQVDITATEPPLQPKTTCCDSEGNPVALTFLRTEYTIRDQSRPLAPDTQDSSTKNITATKDMTSLKVNCYYIWSCNGNEVSAEDSTVIWTGKVYENATPKEIGVPPDNTDIPLGTVSVQRKIFYTEFVSVLEQRKHFLTGTYSESRGDETYVEDMNDGVAYIPPSDCGGIINKSDTPATYSHSGSIAVAYKAISGSYSLTRNPEYTSEGYSEQAPAKHTKVFARKFLRKVHLKKLKNFSGSIGYYTHYLPPIVVGDGEDVTESHTIDETDVDWEPVVGGIKLMTEVAECCSDASDGQPNY